MTTPDRRTGGAMVAVFAVAALLIAAVSAGIAALVSTERLDSRVRAEVARVEREQAAEDLRLEAEATAELARRSQARDDGECVRDDAVLRQPIADDLRAAITSLRQRNLDRAAPGSPCLLPIPEAGDPPRPVPAMTDLSGTAQAPRAGGTSAAPAPTGTPSRPAPPTPVTPPSSTPPSMGGPAAPPTPPPDDRGVVGDLTDTVCSLPVVGPVAC